MQNMSFFVNPPWHKDAENNKCSKRKLSKTKCIFEENIDLACLNSKNPVPI